MAADDKDPVVTTGKDSTLAFTMGETEITKGGNEGLQTDPDNEGKVKKESEEGDAQGADSTGAGDDTAAGAGDEGSDTYTPSLDLGEFKSDDLAKWDKEYHREDGTLSLDRLSEEWWANAGKQDGGETGSLNEGTYAYLKEKLGLSKSDVKDIEAGLKLRTDSTQRAIVEAAGGEEAISAAVAWGKQGGYTEAQRKRFNEIMASGDQEAITDALTAAVARHQKATGGGEDGATPKKDVTKGGAGGGGSGGGDAGFKDEAAYQKQLREVMKMPMGQKKEAARAELQEKLVGSGWFKARNKGK